jgi:hypothetical protein
VAPCTAASTSPGNRRKGLGPRFDTGKTEEDREGDRELTKRIFVIGDETGTACSSVDQTTVFSATSCSRRGDDGAMTE